jgi:predicted nucleic acid-binding protein
MITAVDSNILFDILLPDPKFGPASKEALKRSYMDGSLLICEMVYAELAAYFPRRSALDEVLKTMGIRLQVSSPEVLFEAGHLWRSYKKKQSREQRILADFFVAAHAQHHAEGLMTRDRGFYRKYFKKLKVLSP